MEILLSEGVLRDADVFLWNALTIVPDRRQSIAWLAVEAKQV